MNTTTLIGVTTACLGLALACGADDSSGGSPGAGGVSQTGGSGGQTGGAGGSAASAGAGAVASGGAGGASGSGGSSGNPSFTGLSRVDSGTPDAKPGSAHVAIAPDGTIYVSWVSEANGVLLARSTDGGKSFEPDVQVNGAAQALVSMARLPYVVATDQRVAVTFSDQQGAVYLHVAEASATLSFGAATMIGTDVTTSFRDFPKPVFLGDGSIGVAWHGYPSSGERIFFSRESTGYASDDASSGAPGAPCECCPLDVQRTAAGDLVLVFRNNDNDVREMWSARAAGGGAFASWTELSTTEGVIPACPMMGPRLAQRGTDLVTVWSARGSSTAGAVYTATSSDGGQSWSGGEAAGGFEADEPTIAVGASGRVFVSGVTGSATSAMIQSDDGGKTWSSPEPLAAPDGALRVPQAQGTSGIAALAAVSTAKSVWLRRLE